MWLWGYSGFGETGPQVTPDAPNGFVFNLRYPGQYFDSESGLFYNWHRSYDPHTGRYTQPDPIGLTGGWNRFTYVDSNPLWASDPTGTIALVDDAAMVGLAATAACAVSKPCRDAIGNAMAATAKAIGNAASTAATAISKVCQGDPCSQKAKEISDIAGKLRSKIMQQRRDQWNLYEKAYSTNPGGDIAGKGTWTGHNAQIDSLRVGLAKKLSEAQAMGCPVSPSDWLLAMTPGPNQPWRP